MLGLGESSNCHLLRRDVAVIIFGGNTLMNQQGLYANHGSPIRGMAITSGQSVGE